jgi:hypothetical protein
MPSHIPNYYSAVASNRWAPPTEATLPMPVTIPKPLHIEQPSMSTISNMSIISIRDTSLDVCEYVYGDSLAPFDAIARFYETNAS